MRRGLGRALPAGLVGRAVLTAPLWRRRPAGQRATALPAGRWPLPARGWLARFGLAGACLLADQAVKAWADHALAGRGAVWIARPWIALELVHNRGATLGLGSGHPWLWTILAAVAVPVLAALLLRLPSAGAGLALMLGGTAGNLASRLAAGSVTDFLRVWPWPGVFNLADVFLRVGALLALLAAWPRRTPRCGDGKGAAAESRSGTAP